MEKIKIGNDIAITWKLYGYSAAGLGTLDKSQIRIFVKNEYDTLEIVDFSLEDNVVKLHEILYGEENYEPTKELKSFSTQVEADTKDRLQY